MSTVAKMFAVKNKYRFAWCTARSVWLCRGEEMPLGIQAPIRCFTGIWSLKLIDEMEAELKPLLPNRKLLTFEQAAARFMATTSKERVTPSRSRSHHNEKVWRLENARGVLAEVDMLTGVVNLINQENDR